MADYLEFYEVIGPDVVAVYNARGNYPLGHIEYYAPWRQHVFIPDEGSEYSAGCLEEIVGQMKALNADRRAKARAVR